MTRREIAALAYQLLALAISIYAIVSLAPFVTVILRDFGQGRFRYNAQLHAATLLTCASWLVAAWWIRSRSVDYAARMFCEDSELDASTDLREEEVWSVCCAAIGFIVVVNALSEVVAIVAYQLSLWSSEYQHPINRRRS